MSNRDKAVLVSLNVSIWTANKLDREVSNEVAESKQLKNRRLARVWKSLLPESTSFSRIRGIAAKARKFHYNNTFGWIHEGSRMLPTDNYLEYMDFMRKTKTQFSRAVEAFLQEYGQLRLIAKDALNSIYKESDYPSAESLRSKFRLETFVAPIPAGSMFTAEVESEEQERIREQLEKSVQEAFRAANRDLWNRLYSTISKLQQRLADPKGAREASLESLREMLALLRRLNVSGDEQLERLRKQAEDRLNSFSLKDFKSDETKRATAMAEAARLQEQMAVFMGCTTHAA